MSTQPEPSPWLIQLRLNSAKRPPPLPAENTEPRPHEYQCACTDCRLAAMDRADRTGPNH